MIRIDLHLHSLHSDGTSSVEELVSLARQKRVSVLSLTDHDTAEGILPFLTSCKRNGVQGISGIELSARSPYTLHILGYRFDPQEPELLRALERVRQDRDVRNVQMCEKLTALGVSVSFQEVQDEALGGVIARPHFARVLVRKGVVPDVRSAFDRYLGDGRPGYVSRETLSARECIALIKGAGGLAVMAHPYLTGLNEDELEVLLRELIGHGLWGMECVSSHHDAGQIYRLLALADKLNLYPTAGSDYHGGNRQTAGLGVVVSEEFLPWARLGVHL